MRELNLGIIGINEGNGHPFSYAAIFNGYDPEALATRCPFALIRAYLPRDHRNEVFLAGAKVTHVWTQDRAVSADIAAVSRIPNVSDSIEALVDAVDAVILARDDPWNHLTMARPALAKRKPIFIDKQLAATPEDVATMMALAGPGYPIMAGSPARYIRDVVRARKELAGRTIRSIHGMSRVSWMRYGHHLFEPIAGLFGLDIRAVRSLSANPEHDIVQLSYRSGLNVILEFAKNIHLPIRFTCFSEEAEPYHVNFDDFFHGFREMLSAFIAMVRDGREPFPRSEMIGIANVILAGDISKRREGVPVDPQTLAPIGR